MIGFLYQLGGIVFEATRLVMVQRLLSSAEFKMDPLVSLYYFAPACAIMNGMVALVVEVPKMTLQDVQNVGYFVLIINGVIAFLLNVSVVFLVSSSSALAQVIFFLTRFTDRQDLVPRHDALRCPQGHSPRPRLDGHLPRPCFAAPILRLRYCSCWIGLLQAWRRQDEGARWTSTDGMGRLWSSSPSSQKAACLWPGAHHTFPAPWRHLDQRIRPTAVQPRQACGRPVHELGQQDEQLISGERDLGCLDRR